MRTLLLVNMSSLFQRSRRSEDQFTPVVSKISVYPLFLIRCDRHLDNMEGEVYADNMFLSVEASLMQHFVI